MRVPEANAPETQPEEIDLVHHQMDQPQSFGDFGHGYYFSPRPYTKLTCPSPITGARGLPRFHAGDEAHHCERLVQSQTGEAQVVSFSFPYYYNPSSQPEGPTRSLQSTTDDNGTPATWTLVLFQQAMDRQDRTS